MRFLGNLFECLCGGFRVLWALVEMAVVLLLAGCCLIVLWLALNMLWSWL